MTRAEREGGPRGVDSGGRLPTPTATPPSAEVTSTITDSDVSGRCWQCGEPLIEERAQQLPTGCPCGCRTRLPWFDDPDCIRHQPTPPAVDYRDAADVRDLGLEAHDRAVCERCQAVGR